jgi:hypothetical protein
MAILFFNRNCATDIGVKSSLMGVDPVLYVGKLILNACVLKSLAGPELYTGLSSTGTDRPVSSNRLVRLKGL